MQYAVANGLVGNQGRSAVQFRHQIDQRALHLMRGIPIREKMCSWPFQTCKPNRVAWRAVIGPAVLAPERVAAARAKEGSAADQPRKPAAPPGDGVYDNPRVDVRTDEYRTLRLRPRRLRPRPPPVMSSLIAALDIGLGSVLFGYSIACMCAVLVSRLSCPERPC
jgi:hypothetical protein